MSNTRAKKVCAGATSLVGAGLLVGGGYSLFRTAQKIVGNVASSAADLSQEMITLTNTTATITFDENSPPMTVRLDNLQVPLSEAAPDLTNMLVSLSAMMDVAVTALGEEGLILIVGIMLLLMSANYLMSARAQEVKPQPLLEEKIDIEIQSENKNQEQEKTAYKSLGR